MGTILIVSQKNKEADMSKNTVFYSTKTYGKTYHLTARAVRHKIKKRLLKAKKVQGIWVIEAEGRS